MDAPRTVLIIEDHRIYAKVIQKRFESRGYRAVVASDGFEGLAKARQLRPDLILLDLMLPGLSGHKVCRLIKFDKTLRNTPVAIFTARDTEADETVARASHADAYLLKSVRPEVFLDVTRRLMERGVGGAAAIEPSGVSLEAAAA